MVDRRRAGCASRPWSSSRPPPPAAARRTRRGLTGPVPVEGRSGDGLLHALHARTWHPDARPLPSSRNTGLTLHLPTMTPATQPALHACNHFIAQINAEKTAGAARAAASDLPALILYARCMRAHADRDARPGPDRRARARRVAISTTYAATAHPSSAAADSACRHLSAGERARRRHRPMTRRRTLLALTLGALVAGALGLAAARPWARYAVADVGDDEPARDGARAPDDARGCPARRWHARLPTPATR